jgi:hypothetical protein
VKGLAKGLLGRARALESRIARSVDRAAQTVARAGGRQPLEIAHAVVDAVEAHVQPAGRGRQVFPFTAITVTVLAPSREARAQSTAVFDAAPTLRERIKERLVSAGCGDVDVALTVTYATRAKPAWTAPDFHVTVDRRESAPPQSSVPREALAVELTVVHGTAAEPSYTFMQDRVDLGRCAEVRDSRHRLVRTNHVAFLDVADPVNQSVSRQHAHIDVSPAGECRVYDDRSARGTGVLRRGKTVPVPPGSRGLRLQAGDEIVLGDARVRVTRLTLRRVRREP